MISCSTPTTSVVVVLEWNGQKGLRAIAGPRIERARAAEVETRRVVGIFQVDRLPGHRGRRDNALGVRRAVRVAQRNRRKRDRRPGGAAIGDAHRVVAHDHEAQLAAGLADEVEAPAIGVGQLFGAEQDHLQEAVVITLRRQRDAELDQAPVGEFPVLAKRMCCHRPLPGGRGGRPSAASANPAVFKRSYSMRGL